MTKPSHYTSHTRGWSSLDVARWHMKHSLLTGTSWSVALVVSMYHNKERGYAFPTIEKIVEDTPFSRRSIARAIQEMKESGEWHVVTGRGGPNSPNYAVARTNRYYPIPASPEDDKPPSEGDVDEGGFETESAPVLTDENPSKQESSEPQNGDSEVPGWHVTNEKSGARVAPHSDSQVPGWHVTPPQSGARVALHPPSEVPGWHPKGECTIKEREVPSLKGENKKEKENRGEGRSSSLTTVGQKNQRDQTSPNDPKFSSSNTSASRKKKTSTTAAIKDRTSQRILAALSSEHQQRFEQELRKASVKNKNLFAATTSSWKDENFEWLTTNSADATAQQQSITSLLGWIVKFGGIYAPRPEEDHIDPDRKSTPDEHRGTL